MARHFEEFYRELHSVQCTPLHSLKKLAIFRDKKSKLRYVLQRKEAIEYEKMFEDIRKYRKQFRYGKFLPQEKSESKKNN